MPPMSNGRSSRFSVISRSDASLKPTVVVRADSGARLGTGHIVRCLPLASELRRRGACVCFVCRTQTGDLADAIAGAGFETRRLPAAPAPDPASWLGVTQRADAAETLEAVGGLRPHWLIVDHYGIGIEWESALRPCADRIMVIDDL